MLLHLAISIRGDVAPLRRSRLYCHQTQHLYVLDRGRQVSLAVKRRHPTCQQDDERETQQAKFEEGTAIEPLYLGP